jgi:hypothetical protein
MAPRVILERSGRALLVPTLGRPGRGPRAVALASLLLLVVACGGAADATVDATAGHPGSASPEPVLRASPIALSSPVVGQLVRIDSSGLPKVAGFRLRTGDGTELDFRIGVLENGAEFPPGHLTEHMALGTPIRVFFRLEGGEPVVYRLEDAEQG